MFWFGIFYDSAVRCSVWRKSTSLKFGEFDEAGEVVLERPLMEVVEVIKRLALI